MQVKGAGGLKMITAKSIEKEQDQDIRSRWFKDHQIISHDLFGYARGKTPIEVLVWGKPGTSACRVTYVSRAGTLMVSGDLGEAVFCWNPSGGCSSLRWIAGTSLDYFHGKAAASPQGSGIAWVSFDSALAKAEIQEHVRSNMQDDPHYYSPKKNAGARESLHDLLEAMCCANQAEFCGYLNDNHDEVTLAVNDTDWWEWLPNVGTHMPMRCQAYLIGLKMAFNLQK
ncbi:MAG: hypothetical protein JEZ11_03760 [Desulfobacterales bacterium]|nr:hypothetical protein [Desulfobacterales bacterium]